VADDEVEGERAAAVRMREEGRVARRWTELEPQLAWVELQLPPPWTELEPPPPSIDLVSSATSLVCLRPWAMTTRRGSAPQLSERARRGVRLAGGWEQRRGHTVDAPLDPVEEEKGEGVERRGRTGVESPSGRATRGGGAGRRRRRKRGAVPGGASEELRTRERGGRGKNKFTRSATLPVTGLQSSWGLSSNPRQLLWRVLSKTSASPSGAEFMG
jgi:hypothetical protein